MSTGSSCLPNGYSPVLRRFLQSLRQRELWGLKGVVWRRLLPLKVGRKRYKLPICGGCDSSVRLGFEVWGESIHPTLRMERLSGMVGDGL
jgi:hypothetical protein